MRLLPGERFAAVLEDYKDSRVAFYKGQGNAGDDLIAQGAGQLFRHYGIEVVTEHEGPDYVMYNGAGNMGFKGYVTCARQRRAAAETAKELGVPVVILPQSWTGPD